MNSAPTNLRGFFLAAGICLAALALTAWLMALTGRYGLVELLQGQPPPKPATSPAAQEDALTEPPPGAAPADVPAAASVPTAAVAEPAATAKTPAPTVAGPLSALESLDQEFERLVQKILPSVVCIHTSKELHQHIGMLDRSLNWRYLESQTISQPGVGSGVIVTKEGHILTNFHVIKDLEPGNGDELYVTLNRQTEPQEVEIVGVNRKVDIAVLKLHSTGIREFVPLQFGDSAKLRMGNVVLAFGAPFGLSETVTQGIVSKVDRRLGDSQEAMPFIQTDTVINPGNSGGPLVNVKGEVIGINWAIYSGQQEVHVWQGVGLAIPSNLASQAMKEILTNDVQRSYVGLAFDDVPAFQGGKGVIVSAVDKGSPAFTAGLRVGDLIVQIDGTAVANATDASKLVARRKVDEEIEFSVVRNKQPVAPLRVKVMDVDRAVSEPEVIDLTAEAGLKIKDGDWKEHNKLRQRQWRWGRQFVLVSEVAPEGPLAGKVEPGDVIWSVNGKFCAAEEVAAVLRENPPGGSVMLRIWRGTAKQFNVEITR